MSDFTDNLLDSLENMSEQSYEEITRKIKDSVYYPTRDLKTILKNSNRLAAILKIQIQLRDPRNK